MILRYELPEQHEPLVVLIPEEGAPENGMDSGSLAEEIKGRRAEGATATLVFDGALRETARESGLLVEEGVLMAADPLSAEGIYAYLCIKSNCLFYFILFHFVL